MEELNLIKTGSTLLGQYNQLVNYTGAQPLEPDEKGLFAVVTELWSFWFPSTPGRIIKHCLHVCTLLSLSICQSHKAVQVMSGEATQTPWREAEAKDRWLDVSS